jgi:cytochrome c oxidase assembly protein subunit 15
MSSHWKSRILLANVIAEMAIVVTGAVVRVTSSGLGCPTWPQCVPGSITPTSTQTQAWHKYVEFGNRTLTSVLVALAIAAIVAMHNEASIFRRLAWFILAGIFAQAIIGGVSVLTGLNPYWVMAHFLVSLTLIAAASSLHWKYTRIHANTLEISGTLSKFTRIQTLVALAVIVMGTIVTGSGPHAGDSADIARIPLDPTLVAWFHADVVLLFIGLTIGLIVSLSVSDAPAEIQKASRHVLYISLAQGAVGYVQHFTGLPWVLVALHVLGAVLLWNSCLRLRFAVSQ